MSKWISVKERLPEEYENVLFWHVESEDDAFVCYGYSCVGGFYDHLIDERRGNVTHWMPLPSPPLEGSKE